MPSMPRRVSTTKRGAPRKSGITGIAKKSLKKHRTGDNCRNAKKMLEKFEDSVRAAPPPMA
jgi:hypothetical protein